MKKIPTNLLCNGNFIAYIIHFFDKYMNMKCIGLFSSDVNDGYCPRWYSYRSLFINSVNLISPCWWWLTELSKILNSWMSKWSHYFFIDEIWAYNQEKQYRTTFTFYLSDRILRIFFSFFAWHIIKKCIIVKYAYSYLTIFICM